MILSVSIYPSILTLVHDLVAVAAVVTAVVVVP
jgi:hypothetical protein